jgi:predicted deacylase
MKFGNEISCRFDLETPGKRAGFLSLSHSDDRNAFGVIPLPIAVLANGEGPTVLLSAGNHGDEYEGQVILRRLFNETEPEMIRGRIILLPALNYPAVMADRRVSPLDGENLNRSFPGTSAGPTGAIAGFVTQQLLPLADAAIDFHSGGRAAAFVPSAFLCTHPDAAVSRASLELAEAFAAPFTYVVRGSDSPRGMDPHAQAYGVAFISTELSGGAGVDIEATAIGYAGLRRVLAHTGNLASAGEPAAARTRLLDGMDGATTVMAPISGVFEPFVPLGGEVSAGQPAGRVWSIEEFDRPPVPLAFNGSGVVAARRAPARVVRGSFCYIVAPGITREAVLSMRD